MTDPHDELFEDDFAQTFAPLPPFNCPMPDDLPPAGLDIIQRRLGIDISGEDVTLGQRLAANEWFWRRAAGQKVTFGEVMRGGSMRNAMREEEQAGADPTGPAAPTQKRR